MHRDIVPQRCVKARAARRRFAHFLLIDVYTSIRLYEIFRHTAFLRSTLALFSVLWGNAFAISAYAIFSARLNDPFSESIFFCNCKMEYSSASGRGGHPGTYTSTGSTWLHPCTIA